MRGSTQALLILPLVPSPSQSLRPNALCCPSGSSEVNLPRCPLWNSIGVGRSSSRPLYAQELWPEQAHMLATIIVPAQPTLVA